MLGSEKGKERKTTKWAGYLMGDWEERAPGDTVECTTVTPPKE